MVFSCVTEMAFECGSDVGAPNYVMEPRDYHIQILVSFLVCAFIHHIGSPLYFRKNVAYSNLPKNKRMEWDSRVMSTFHASVVSVLCIVALVKERELWRNPFFAQSPIALTSLCISIGYFICDLISMPLYYDRKNMLIFTVHHSVAIIAFYLIMVYRVDLFFGVYRLTTELSTPFTNQRWFYRKIGYTLDRRRVAMVSLVFSILFVITRNLMIFPYWVFIYMIYDSPHHRAARASLPGMDFFWFLSSCILDILNIYWALMVYPIGIKSAYKLYKADWRTDFDRARDNINVRFQRARHRAMNTGLIGRLRRSASFSRIQLAWQGWAPLSSGADIPKLSVSERSSPLQMDSDDEAYGALKTEKMNGGVKYGTRPSGDDEGIDTGLTMTFHRKRSMSNSHS